MKRFQTTIWTRKGRAGSYSKDPMTTDPRKGGNGKPRQRIAAATLGIALAVAIVTPSSASASGHTCSANDVCFYNSAGFLADAPGALTLVNPWNAVAGNYPNLYNPFPFPHTYNNPDTCNNVNALSSLCNENDTISSIRNLSPTRKVRFFNNANYSGSYQTLFYLSNDGQADYNNQISSFCGNDGSAGVSACSF